MSGLELVSVGEQTVWLDSISWEEAKCTHIENSQQAGIADF